MTKAFLNSFALALCLVFFLLWLNGYQWEPLAVIVIAVAIIAAGTPAQWPTKKETEETVPAPQVGASPGYKWWEDTGIIPVDVTESEARRGRHA
jgi:hypothetical protein